MTQDFSTLAKANSNTKMTEAWKNLATKNQVENGLDLGEKKNPNVLFTCLLLSWW